MSTILKPVGSLHNWGTPIYIFDPLNERFEFDIDVAADSSNAKLLRYFTKEENGLIQSWEGLRCFDNPEYGPFGPIEWLKKHVAEIDRCPLSTALVKAATDTAWFHRYGMEKATTGIIIEGRIPYDPPSDYKAPINKKTGRREMSGNNHGSIVFVYEGKQPRSGIKIETWSPKHIPLKQRVSKEQWEEWHRV